MKKQTNNNITQHIKEAWEKGLNNHEIKTELENKGIDRNIHYIENVVYRLKVRGGSNTHNTHNTPHTTQEADKKREDFLTLEIKEDNRGNVGLFIQTSKEFEAFLKDTKEQKHTNNLFERDKEGDFYYMNLENEGIYSDYDDINRAIYDRATNRINKAIFRVVGISKGLNFNLSLMSEKQLKLSLKKLVGFYAEFYNKVILQKKLNFRASVYGVIEND